MKESNRTKKAHRERSFCQESGSDSGSQERLSGNQEMSLQKNEDHSESIMSKKLYLGGVPVTMKEDELREIISKRVKKFDLQILRHKDHGNSKGCAWIEVYNEDDFVDLISKKLTLLDKELPLTEYITDVEQRKKRMNENHERQCFFGGLPLEATKEHVDSYFSRFGTVTNSYIIYQEQNKSRGFGFVEFESSDIVWKVLSIKDHKIMEKEILVEKRTTKTALKHSKKDPRCLNQSQKHTDESMNSQPSKSEEASREVYSEILDHSAFSKQKSSLKEQNRSKNPKVDSQNKHSTRESKRIEDKNEEKVSGYSEQQDSSKHSKRVEKASSKPRWNYDGEDEENGSYSNISSYEASIPSFRSSEMHPNNRQPNNLNTKTDGRDSFDFQKVYELPQHRKGKLQEECKNLCDKTEKLQSNIAGAKMSRFKHNSISENAHDSDSESIKTTPYQQKQNKKADSSLLRGSSGYSNVLEDSWKPPKEEKSLESNSVISDIPKPKKSKHSKYSHNDVDPDEIRRQKLEEELAALNAKRMHAQKHKKRMEPLEEAVSKTNGRSNKPDHEFKREKAHREGKISDNSPRRPYEGEDRYPSSQVYQNPVYGPQTQIYDHHSFHHPGYATPQMLPYGPYPPRMSSPHRNLSPYRQASPPRMAYPLRATSPSHYQAGKMPTGFGVPNVSYPIPHPVDPRQYSPPRNHLGRALSPRKQEETQSSRQNPMMQVPRPRSPTRHEEVFVPRELPYQPNYYGRPTSSYPGPYPGFVSPGPREYMDYPQHYPPHMMQQGYDPYPGYSQYHPGYEASPIMPPHQSQPGYYYPPQHPGFYGHGPYLGPQMHPYGIPATQHMRAPSPGSPRQQGVRDATVPLSYQKKPAIPKKPKGHESDDEEDLFDYIFARGGK
jgi:RNA recognition motif. (a.k.a. RRM, RBD, or RNP domain)